MVAADFLHLGYFGNVFPRILHSSGLLSEALVALVGGTYLNCPFQHPGPA